MNARMLAAVTATSEPVEVNLSLVVIAAGLIGCGVYLLLERSLSRVLVGLVMMGNGVSIAFLVASGSAGKAPIVTDEQVDPSAYADPLPQAMVLTAIVIMLATVSFVLAMAYRSWQLTGHDDVQDDVEDALIRRMAAKDIESDSFRAEQAEVEEEPATDFTGDQAEVDPVVESTSDAPTVPPVHDGAGGSAGKDDARTDSTGIDTSGSRKTVGDDEHHEDPTDEAVFPEPDETVSDESGPDETKGDQ